MTRLSMEKITKNQQKTPGNKQLIARLQDKRLIYETQLLLYVSASIKEMIKLFKNNIYIGTIKINT